MRAPRRSSISNINPKRCINYSKGCLEYLKERVYSNGCLDYPKKYASPKSFLNYPKGYVDVNRCLDYPKGCIYLMWFIFGQKAT